MVWNNCKLYLNTSPPDHDSWVCVQLSLLQKIIYFISSYLVLFFHSLYHFCAIFSFPFPLFTFCNFWVHLQNCEKWPLASSCSYVHRSVCPRGTAQLPLDRFSWNFMFECFFFKSVKKIQVSLKSWIMNTLHEDEYTHMIMSCLLLIRMRDFSDKSHRENHNTQFVFNSFLLFVLSMR